MQKETLAYPVTIVGSLTAVLSKVLERIVVQQLNDQFSGVRQPLSDTQYGFRRHRSTNHLLVHAVNDLAHCKGCGQNYCSSVY